MSLGHPENISGTSWGHPPGHSGTSQRMASFSFSFQGHLAIAWGLLEWPCGPLFAHVLALHPALLGLVPAHPLHFPPLFPWPVLLCLGPSSSLSAHLYIQLPVCPFDGQCEGQLGCLLLNSRHHTRLLIHGTPDILLPLLSNIPTLTMIVQSSF